MECCVCWVLKELNDTIKELEYEPQIPEKYDRLTKDFFYKLWFFTILIRIKKLWIYIVHTWNIILNILNSRELRLYLVSLYISDYFHEIFEATDRIKIALL